MTQALRDLGALPRRLSVPDLVRFAVELGATDCGGPLSASEVGVIRETLEVPRPSEEELNLVRRAAAEGRDLLGDAFIGALSHTERRPLGAVYTPGAIIDPMVAWVLDRRPQRVVDAGAGSGRYAVAVARANPSVEIVAVDVDPVATLICRANLAMQAHSKSRVIQGDYTKLDLSPINGRTAFVGNPPYVRHHELDRGVKAWAKSTGERFGYAISGLTGLHVYFFLATALQAQPGDVGCYVTSAEWLDVRYGLALRKLLQGPLEVQSLHLVNPRSVPFQGAMTTALITCFEAGRQEGPILTSLVNHVAELGDLNAGQRVVLRHEATKTERWSSLFGENKQAPAVLVSSASGLVPLGSFVRVSRGIATGDNSFFVMTPKVAAERGLAAFARPAVTRAQEVFESPGVIRATPERRVVIDLPKTLGLQSRETSAVRQFIQEGEEAGVHQRYLCAHRNPWWSLGAGQAPSIVATYMARQAPAFALNPDGLTLLNIAHGLYLRVPMAPAELLALVGYLNDARDLHRGRGRTYHGGLEKFEPREMESLLVPSLEGLRRIAKEQHATA